jgi:ABC-type Mn2+/Zn2+ transport system permease subunit
VDAAPAAAVKHKTRSLASTLVLAALVGGIASATGAAARRRWRRRQQAG